ncbi:MAG: hypothetical protein K8S27_06095 [Candidatus Omnitrophica bacterium]|nr:hypothetical protein [Candidatus Omnitrophota bacterium]
MLKRLIKNKKAQSVLEYTSIIVILLGAFVGISNYYKRGIQGRWKAAVDGLGDQYDPRLGNTSLLYTLEHNTNTQLITVDDPTGYWSRRRDMTVSTERKIGYEGVASY